MCQLLETHTQRLEARLPPDVSKSNLFDNAEPTSNEHVIVLTGATGSLGALLVHTLALSTKVRSLICLCRASSDEEARTRVDESLCLLSSAAELVRN